MVTVLVEPWVVSDPEILGGVPIVRGTRMPTWAVRVRLAEDDLAAEYPSIPREAWEAAIAYADAHPRKAVTKRFR